MSLSWASMTIHLDDNLVQWQGETLGEILQAAQDAVASTGRIVVEISVDGQALLEDQIQQRQDEPVGNLPIRFISAHPRELAIDALNETCLLLDQARTLHAEAAELLRQDKTTEAMAQMAQLFGLWQQTQAAVLQSVQLVGLDLTNKKLDDEPVVDLIRNLADQLKELRDLLGSADVLGLADAMAYEWPQTLDQWQHLIGELIGWIQEDDNNHANP